MDAFMKILDNYNQRLTSLHSCYFLLFILTKKGLQKSIFWTCWQISIMILFGVYTTEKKNFGTPVTLSLKSTKKSSVSHCLGLLRNRE